MNILAELKIYVSRDHNQAPFGIWQCRVGRSGCYKHQHSTGWAKKRPVFGVDNFAIFNEKK